MNHAFYLFRLESSSTVAHPEDIHIIVRDAGGGAVAGGGVVGAGPVNSQAAVGVGVGGGLHLDGACLDCAGLRCRSTAVGMSVSPVCQLMDHSTATLAKRCRGVSTGYGSSQQRSETGWVCCRAFDCACFAASATATALCCSHLPLWPQLTRMF